MDHKRLERHLLMLKTIADDLGEVGAYAAVAVLSDIISDMIDAGVKDITAGAPGKKTQSVSRRIALAAFAAAITTLKDGRRVDEVISEIATANGVSRKELKNFRDRLNRGRADKYAFGAYKIWLSKFEGMPKAEIMIRLKICGRDLYLTPPS